MSGINKVILVGYVGRKPELKYTSAGVPVCNFSLATTERLGKDDSGQAREHTEWHRVTCWRRLAEICAQWVDKGQLLYVEGRLRTREWQTQEGEKRRTTEIEMDNMQMLGGRGQRSETGSVPDAVYDDADDFGSSQRGGGAFRAESGGGASSFPGNGNGTKTATRQAASTQVEAPEVIDLDNLQDDEFF